MKETPNIGESGMKSIRIGGMKIEDLPIGESALAKMQLPLVENADREQKIKGILASAPKPSVVYLQSRIKEAHENIIRIQQMKDKETQTISEYTSLIAMCIFRDKELAKTDDKEKIKELNLQFPPYNVEAMEQQIVQSKETIERCDSVIAQEYASIAELHETVALCEKRDTDLKNLGAELP